MRIVIGVILSVLAMWLATGFVVMEWNPVAWSESLRFFLTVMAATTVAVSPLLFSR